MSTVHMILLKNGLDSKEKTQMLDQIDKVDGVKWSLGMNSLIGPSIPGIHDSFQYQRNAAVR